MNQLFDNIENEALNQIRILLYKKNKDIFEILDFENELIYKEPLLFAFFNSKADTIQNIESLIYGYASKDLIYVVFSDEYGRIYMPNVGWLHTEYKNESFLYDKVNSKLLKNDQIIDYRFEELELIENTQIELIKYSVPLLKKCYFDTDLKLIDVEIENISKKHLKHLTKAYNLIKKYVPQQFELIENYAPKCVIFDVDTYQRNSFATFSAHGIGFYNAYQQCYDEVFFIDDIAHQTGHVILNSMTFDADKFFTIDKQHVLKTLEGPFVEKRSIYIVYHALYTYYTSFICLDSCIENGAFQGKQKHEAIGRIVFYINKCYSDLLLIESDINSEIVSNDYFTEQGFLIYKTIKDKWKEMYNKWYKEVKILKLDNQPYNFTYEKFIELNPLLLESSELNRQF